MSERDGRAGGDTPSDRPRASDEPGSARQRRERKAVLLRLDPAVHDALARWAADDLRSTNAHLEWLLRRALADANRLPPNPPPTGGGGWTSRQ